MQKRLKISSCTLKSMSDWPDDMERFLSSLDEREREILKMRHGLAPYSEPHTLEEVGEAFAMTRERVRQFEARAMTKLRHQNLDTGEDD